MKARLFLLSLVLAGTTFLGAAEPNKPVRYKDLIETSFQRWDANKDGKLSPQEINALILDPAITGDEAAAVAAIHRYLRRGGKNQPEREPLTKADLLAPEGVKIKKLTTEGGEAAISKDKVYIFRDHYRSFRDRLAKAPREIFAGTAPRLEGMHQSFGGDCYIISVIGGRVHADPARLKQMMRPRKDGSCEVVFGTGQRVVVPRLTDAQIALGSSAGDQGLWLNVLEEAVGQIKFADESKRRPGDIALDTITHGGKPDFTIKLLSGHQPAGMGLKNPKDPAALRKTVTATLKTGMAGKLLMACSIGKGAKPPPGMIAFHIYGVLGYEAKGDKVLIWNPHGNDFKPAKDPPGLENGYPVKDGRFEVPLREFVQIFDFLSWETTEPAKRDEPVKKK